MNCLISFIWLKIAEMFGFHGLNDGLAYYGLICHGLTNDDLTEPLVDSDLVVFYDRLDVHLGLTNHELALPLQGSKHTIPPKGCCLVAVGLGQVRLSLHIGLPKLVQVRLALGYHLDVLCLLCSSCSPGAGLPRF